MSFFYPIASSTWDGEEIDAIQEVIRSDQFTMAGTVSRFEEKFADYHGRKFAVMVNSGSSANLIAIAAFCHHGSRKLNRGDEIIVPTLSWSTTYSPMHQYGLKFRFVDIDLSNLGLDTSQLAAALTPETRAIAGVSILGNPCALDEIRAFSNSHNLWFLEDNCESFDAELGGRKTGTFGDISTFSFFFSHQISTTEGGMLLMDDLELYHLSLALRAHGWTRDLPQSSPIFRRKETDFFEQYRFILPGYNVRPTEINAAIGLKQLDKLSTMTTARRKNLSLFESLFEEDSRFKIQKENGKSSSFCFPLILSDELNISRDEVLSALHDNGIEHRIITGGNILRNDVISFYDHFVVNGSAPNTDKVHDRGFFVGNQPRDLTLQIEKLYEVLNIACR